MDNLQLLFDKNDSSLYNRERIKLDKACFVYTVKDGIIDGVRIRDIIRCIQGIIRRYKKIPLPIEFRLGRAKFMDKLTISLLECICYFIVEKNSDVRIMMDFSDTILSEGIRSSPLLLLTSSNPEKRKEFSKKFGYDLYNNHYRRMIFPDEKIILSKVFDEVSLFQSFFEIAKIDRESIAEIVVELAGNACEHANSNCLLDIDITSDYKKSNHLGNFFGININIINFSTKLFYQDVSDKFHNDLVEMESDRYLYVKKAYNNHRSHFEDNSEYSENDFFTIAAFQHRISGRISPGARGGTGLTKLIKGLQVRCDAHKCYMVSGRKRLVFLPEYLEYNQDGWIGFNKDNDFIGQPPDIGLFDDMHLFIPGTAYNLTFVLKKGE